MISGAIYSGVPQKFDGSKSSLYIRPLNYILMFKMFAPNKKRKYLDTFQSLQVLDDPEID